LGSAAFHVGGGALSLCATRAGATGPGFFAAPGVLGLALGGALAAAGHIVVWPFLLLLVGLGIAVLVQPLPALSYTTEVSEPLLENHDLIMIALLTAIALRSAVWSTFQFVLAGNLPALLALAIAAAIGKILGGVLADRVGWRRWTVGALLVSAPLLAIGSHRFELLLVGVTLLQSATPVALAMTAQLLPRQPATASGLVLGLAIALGAAPLIGDMGAVMSAPISLAVITLLAALAFWLAGPRLRVAPT